MVTVLGGGRMAEAYAETLRSGGVTTSESDAAHWPEILTAFYSGVESYGFLRSGKVAEGSIIVDLTTLGIHDATRCEREANRLKATYLAGGVTGGVRQVGTSEFTILIGGSSGKIELPGWLSLLGRIKTYERIEHAVGSKLLHNLALILMNHAIGSALRVAREHGISELLEVLESGTAGRPLRTMSVVRDGEGIPTSSYGCGLAAKDLRAMLSSFPELETIVGLDLTELAEAYARNGAVPYTSVSNEGCSQAARD